MGKIRIEVHEGGVPAATITIPLWLAKWAPQFMPKIAGQMSREQVDFDKIIELAKTNPAAGVILDIEDHEDKDRLIISIVDE